MSKNAIGTGAIIITASSDKLASGLAHAEGKIDKFAGSANRKLDKVGGKGAAGGGGKGIFGGVLSANLAMKGIEQLLKLPETIGSLAEKATGADKGALLAIVDGLNRIVAAGEQLLTKGLAAAAPTIVSIIDTVLRTVERLTPTFEDLLRIFERWSFFLAEVFGLAVDSIGDVIAEIAGLVASWVGVDTQAQTSGKLIFGVVRMVAKGFAYAWDVIKAGAGVVAWVAGKIVEGFGLVVKQIGKAIGALADLADKLPDDIKVRFGLDGLRPAAEAVKGWGEGVEGLGKRIEQWGERQLNNFGESAKRADEWMDGVEQRFNERKADFARRGAEAEKQEPLKETKLAGALRKGSTEAYSVAVRNQIGQQIERDNAKALLRNNEKQLEELKRLNKNIEAQEAGLL